MTKRICLKCPQLHDGGSQLVNRTHADHGFRQWLASVLQNLPFASGRCDAMLQCAPDVFEIIVFSEGVAK